MCEGTSASAGASLSVGTRVFESRMEVGHNTSLTPLLWGRTHFRLSSPVSICEDLPARKQSRNLSSLTVGVSIPSQQAAGGWDASEAHSAAFGRLVRCNSGGWSAPHGSAQSRGKVEV